MKIFDYIFQDFWRKLVALIFAVVIYWQAGGFEKKSEARAVAQVSAPVETEEKLQLDIQKVSRDVLAFPVGIVDSGAGRRVVFAPGVRPQVKATLRGEDLSDIQSGVDLRFYVDPPHDLKPGRHELPVLYHVRRPEVMVISVVPETISVSIDENPVSKP